MRGRDELQADRFVMIECDDTATAKRIIARAVAKHWWFLVEHCEDRYYISLSEHVELDRDLRAKLPALNFRLA